MDLDTELLGLAGKIREAHAACVSSAQTVVQKAIIAGELLSCAKAGIGHGEWKPWVLENCGFSLRTSQLYMKVAQELPTLDGPKAQRVALLPLREALSAVSDRPQPDPEALRVPSHIILRNAHVDQLGLYPEADRQRILDVAVEHAESRCAPESTPKLTAPLIMEAHKELAVTEVVEDDAAPQLAIADDGDVAADGVEPGAPADYQANAPEEPEDGRVPQETDDLPDVCLAERPMYQHLRTEISALKRKINDLRGRPSCTFLMLDPIITDLDNVWRAIRFGMPHCKCRRCRGTLEERDDCDLCKGMGFNSLSTAKQAPKDLEEEADA